MNKKGFIGMKGLIILAIIVIFFFFFPAHFGIESGTGKQIGIFSEVEKSGFLFKPYNVVLLNIQPTYSQKDTSYDYGASEELAKQAEMYLANNTKVTVYYELKNFVWAWDYSSRIIITKIVPLE